MVRHKMLIVPGSLAFLLLVVLLSGSNAMAQDSQVVPPKTSTDANMQNFYFIFLTTGKSTDGVDQGEIQKMQAKHLENFNRLAGEGKLLTAGPMADPDRNLRGIVVVKAERPEKVMELFGPDPYIQNGYLKVDAYPMEFVMGRLNTKVDPAAMEEFRIVVLSGQARPELADDVNAANSEYFRDHFAEDQLRLVICMSPSIDMPADATVAARKMVLIARKKDAGQIEALADGIPAVKSGAWTQKTMPLYLSKGTL